MRKKRREHELLLSIYLLLIKVNKHNYKYIIDEKGKGEERKYSSSNILAFFLLTYYI
jgi:hypothetical protein